MSNIIPGSRNVQLDDIARKLGISKTTVSRAISAIPRDIRVASLYNSMYLDMYSPPITALNFRAGDLGAAAANLLLDILEEKETQRETVLGFEMLIRKSTMYIKKETTGVVSTRRF